jgi:UPF0716 protein FxsA
MGRLFLLFVAIPLLDLVLLLRIGSRLGFWNTVGIVVGTAAVGAYFVKQQGLAVWARINRELARGRLPGQALLDGLLILVAGVLLVTPGFVTDVAALILLVPPTRAVVRVLLARRFQARFRFPPGQGPGPGGHGRADEEVITVYPEDTDGGTEHDRDRPDR